LNTDYAGNLDPEGQRLLHVIRQNAQRMGLLIDDLLTFSRIGRTNMLISTIEMNKLVRSVIDDYFRQDKQVEFHVDDLVNGAGDAGMIRQVWINLVSNAVKFSKYKSHPVIRISSLEENDRVTYSINDNGAGFDMQYYDKLFGVFQRLHTEKEFEGTGVGLAIVHQVITRHNGKIWAESSLGNGSTFYFTLPKAIFG